MTEKMKPSGFDYLGNIPASWDVKRFKYCVQICNGGEYADIEVEEGGYPVIGSGGEFARASQYCYRGESVLLGRKGTVDKPLYVNDAFWCVDTMFYTKAKQGMIPKFLYYCALCFRFDYYVTATALPSMTQKDLGSEMIAVPPTNEQQAIANFLDAQCAKIDSVIADIEKQIETLQKYKKSLITEAVTKGLNRSVPTKNSGIDWIGEIPVHWKTIPLKHLFSLYAGGDVNEYDFSDEQTEKYKYPIYSNSLENHGLFGYTSKYRFSGKTFTVTGRGEVGKAVPRFDSYYPIVRLLACIPKNNANNEYYAYCVNSADVLGDQTAMAQLTTQKLGMLVVPLPSADEQKRISDYLNNQCAKTDAVIDQKREQLSILLQHKKSLIYEYVTGKKRVTEVN